MKRLLVPLALAAALALPSVASPAASAVRAPASGTKASAVKAKKTVRAKASAARTHDGGSCPLRDSVPAV